MGIDQTHQNMKMFQISSSVFLLVLTLSFSVSWASLSSILDVTNASEDILSCISSNFGDAPCASELILSPANVSFVPAWQSAVMYLKFLTSPKPSVIVTPTDDTMVKATLYCTKKYGYELRIKSGGHDFEGLSYTADVPFVMIDFTKMRSIDVDVQSKTAWVQPGAALGAVYYAISQKTDTLYFPAGLCPTVNIGGYLGGAGYGNLLRKYATGADNTLDVKFMNVDGNILDRKSMGEDLFWAIRGGGSSSFGIVLAWKISLVDVPEKVTYFKVIKTLEEGLTDIFYKYQTVASTIDENLLIRTTIVPAVIGGKKTVVCTFEGAYQGTIDTLIPLLDNEFPELGVTEDICQEMRSVQLSLATWGLPATTTPPEILLDRSAFTKASIKAKSDYVRNPIPKSGLEKIWARLLEDDASTAQLVINPFGGKMAEYSETAIPFPHRAGVLFQLYKAVFFTEQVVDTTPASQARIAWLNSFQEFLTPYVSSNPREAFYNYIDLDLGVGNANYEEASLWGDRYWKSENFKKLIRIKAQVDPENFFRHPQSIPVFSTSSADK